MHLLITAAPPHPTATALTRFALAVVLLLIGALAVRALREHHRRVMPRIRALPTGPGAVVIDPGPPWPADYEPPSGALYPPHDVAVDAAGRRFVLEHDSGDVTYLDDAPGGDRG